MPDIGELNLKIRVNPDTGQLQIFNDEVGQLEGQVKDLTEESEGLNKSFTRPLENVGVHIFGHELLGTMGISQATRPILTLLSIGIREVGESFGVAAATAMPYVFGLAALAAVAYEVAKGTEKSKEAIESTLAVQQSAIAPTKELHDALVAYEKTVNGLPPELTALKKATDALLESQKHEATQTQGELLAAMQKRLLAAREEIGDEQKSLKFFQDKLRVLKETDVGFQENADSVDYWAEKVKKAQKDIDQLPNQIKIAEADIKSEGKSAETAAQHLQTLGTEHSAAAAKAHAFHELMERDAKERLEFEKQGEEARKHFTQSVAEEDAKLAKITEDLNDETEGLDRSDQEKKLAQIKKFYDDKLLAIEAAYKKEHELGKGDPSGQTEIKAVKERNDAIAALNANRVAKEKQVYSDIAQAGIEAAHQIEEAFAQAAAKIVMGNPDLDDAANRKLAELAQAAGSGKSQN